MLAGMMVGCWFGGFSLILSVVWFVAVFVVCGVVGGTCRFGFLIVLAAW